MEAIVLDLILSLGRVKVQECWVIAESQRQTLYIVEEDTGLSCLTRQGLVVNYVTDPTGHKPTATIGVRPE